MRDYWSRHGVVLNTPHINLDVGSSTFCMGGRKNNKKRRDLWSTSIISERFYSDPLRLWCLWLFYVWPLDFLCRSPDFCLIEPWFLYKHCLTKERKKSHTLIFLRTTFSLDYGAHSPSFKISFWSHFIPPGFNNVLDSSSPSFSSFITRLCCFLCLMQANNLTPLRQNNIFSTTTESVLWHGC